jgi:hypothetical protein
MADAQRDGSDVVRNLGQLLGLAAGVVALVYAAGGGVLALRLYLAHLPSRVIAAQLPRNLLISVGLAQIVLPILAVAGLYVASRVLRGATPPPSSLVRQWKERSPRGWSELVAASALPALVITVTLGLAHKVRGGSKGLAWFLPVAFLVTLLVVLIGLNLRARLVDTYGASASSWSAVRPVVWMTLVVAFVFLPICVLFAGVFFPLPNVRVCMTNGTYVRGVLIAETSERTYIGQAGTGERPRLMFSIPQSEIAKTLIGSRARATPCRVPKPSAG